MNTGLIARASVTIAAPPADVWDALVTPGAIKAHMFDATVTSDWVVGSPIAWTGEWQGRTYEDKGIIHNLTDEARERAEMNWSVMLGGLKHFVEHNRPTIDTEPD